MSCYDFMMLKPESHMIFRMIEKSNFELVNLNRAKDCSGTKNIRRFRYFSKRQYNSKTRTNENEKIWNF